MDELEGGYTLCLYLGPAGRVYEVTIADNGVMRFTLVPSERVAELSQLPTDGITRFVKLRLVK